MKTMACIFKGIILLSALTAIIVSTAADSGNPAYAKIKFNSVVAQDGSGTFRTIKQALDAVPDNSGTRTFIHVKNGIYRENITITAAKVNVSLLGEDMMKTIITYDNYAGKLRDDGKTYGTTGSSSVFIECAGFHAENITFENSADESKITDGAQAVAVRTAADRLVFKNCRFIGNQDTLYVRSGRQYFEKCRIEGDTDFIFGEGPAWFEACELHSLDKPGTSKGYLTASSTPESFPFGYVFHKCTLTAAPGVGKDSVFLGRTWHATSARSPIKGTVAFLYCTLGEHIKTVGWTYMDAAYPVPTERLREYKNIGPGAAGVHSNRIQLTDIEARQYTLKNVLGGTDNWDPTAPLY